jgi:hypothetical protein
MYKMQQLQEQKKTIIDAVHKVFERFRVETDFSSDSEQYRIMDAETGKGCLQFEFMDHEFITRRHPSLPHNPKYNDLTVLHISELSKCGANNGNSLLALVDKLAESIPFIEYISLTDASTIKKCNVHLNLNELKILTSDTGESWYNRWGYKSPAHHAENRSMNSDIRDASMSDFPLLQSAIVDAFPKINTNVSVHECVKSISEQIRSFPEEEEECSEDQINKINALDMLINELNVYYSKGLVKPVSHGGYKRSAKKRSAKKRSTKKRSTKKRSTKKRSANAKTP